MKIMFAVLLAFVLSFELNAQINLGMSPTENTDSMNTSHFLFCSGVLSETHHKNYSPLIEINLNIHIYRSIYLNIGSDAAILFKEIRHDPYGLFIAPNYAFHEEENKVSIFLGGGPYFFHPSVYMNLGWVFFGRVQFNMDRNFSTGFELKLVKPGDSEINGNSYLSGLFYVSIRL